MTDHPEIARVRFVLQLEVERLEATGGNVSAFASALLLGASELYAEVHGPSALGRAFVSLTAAEEAARSAGRC